MRYIVKKEFTGCNGWVERYRHIDDVKCFSTLQEALDFMEARKLELIGPKFKGAFFGGERDYTVLRDTKYGPWLLRYWLEKEPDIDNTGYDYL